MPAFQDAEIYRDILDGMPIGLSVLDLAKKIVFWSDGAQHITGYARIDVLGHSCRENVFLHCNELSCETCAEKCSIRANAARRLMQANGLGASQVTQVRGFADQRLRKLDDPLDASNRRISLIVQYTEKKEDEKDEKDEKGAKPSAGGEEKKLGMRKSRAKAARQHPRKLRARKNDLFGLTQNSQFAPIPSYFSLW